jgi:type IV pilus assembly protein PilP
MAAAEVVAKLLLTGFVATGLAVACGGSAPTSGGAKGSTRPRPGVSASASASASASSRVPTLEFEEYEFGESERSRDPFRAYADVFAGEAKSRVESQRDVLLEKYSLDQLRLIGIVQNANPPLAMVVDPTGKGYSIRRGQFIGRAEVVQSPGQRGAAYELNWRVERIRDGDVVFVREDPQNPDVPSATKVISLHTEKDLLPEDEGF